MSKKICFISNFHITELFEKIAVGLKEKGCEIFWICPNKDAYNKLSKAWGSENTLYIGMSSVISYQRDAETPYPESLIDINSNDLVIRDRILKYRSTQGAEYLSKLKTVAFDFLTKNKITAVFGEATWSHEVLINRICLQVQECTATYYNPLTLRLPQQTFGFFLDEYQSNLSQHKTVSDITDEMSERYDVTIVNSSNKELPLPEYLTLMDDVVTKANSFSNQLMQTYNLFFKSIDKQDPTLETSKSRRFFGGVIKYFKAKAYSQFKKIQLQDVIDLNYYLYPLHKQPEASIDVIGKYYDDQLLNIRNIASQLKDDEYLLVKEHSNAIGDRGYSFYNQLSRYPRVLLVNEQENMKQLIKYSRGVFTVSGTAALEAALMGVDCFCFSKVYFRDLAHCKMVSIQGFDKNQRLSTAKAGQLDKRAFAHKLLTSACNGIISDPISDIRCIHPENIRNLVQEFYAVINQ